LGTQNNYFGQRVSAGMSAWEDNIHAVLETLDGFVKAGKSSILDCQMKIHGESCVFLEKTQQSAKSKTIQNPLLD
jgi:hypothetical protein